MNSSLFAIWRFKRQTTRYEKLMAEGLGDYFGRPEYLTLVFLPVEPEEKKLSERLVTKIEAVINPLLANQRCRQHGESFEFRNFLGGGRLTPESRVHLFAHITLHYVSRLVKSGTCVLEHVIRDGDGNLGIAFNQKFDSRFDRLVSFLWERYNLLLDGRISEIVTEEREIGLLGRILRKISGKKDFAASSLITAL